MHLPAPDRFALVAAAAEGLTPLTAFDAALLAAGMGNLNLVRISSVLPAGCRRDDALTLPPGTLVPTAYGHVTSDFTGELICAAIGVGVGPDGWGIIMEYSGRGPAEGAEKAVRRMVDEAFEQRGLELAEFHVKAVQHEVESLGCAFAAAALYWKGAGR